MLKNTKTNLKYLLIVFILAAIVGGGILWWTAEQEIPQLPEIKIPPKVQDETANWNTYNNENLDISFKYPPTWNPENIYKEEGLFSLNFKTTELKQYDKDQVNLYIVGINNKYEEVLGGWFGYCAVEFSSIEEFCKKGCKKLSNNVAIDYRVQQHGDFTFSGIVYTNLSKDYPSLCFELDLTQVAYELSEEKNIKYYEVADKYDLKSLIENKQVSISILNAVNNFEKFAGSIKSIEGDETANWQTYRNEEYGFEIKYPSGCLIEITKENEELYLEFSNSTPENFDICTGGFSVRKNKKQLSLKEWILDLYDFSQLTFEEIRNSAGIIALRIPIEQNEQFNEKFGGYPWFEAPEEIEYEYLPGTQYWITGNKNWIFSLFHFQDGGLLDNEMLSTFTLY